VNQRWITLKTWWIALAEREQRIIIVGGFITAVAIFYSFIWHPYLSAIHLLRKRIAADHSTLAYMKALDVKIQQTQKQAQTKRISLESIALLTELQKQVEKSGLQSSLQPLKHTSQDNIEMHFKRVEFDKLIQFMLKMNQTYQITLTQFSVKKDASAGIVNADLTIKRD
jgi:type II secretory pathway component PulM